MSTNDSTPPIKIKRSTAVSMPLAVLIGVISFAVVAATVWASRGDEVRIIRADTDRHGHDIADLQTEARTTRELLIRIDANVQQLKEQRAGQRQ